MLSVLHSLHLLLTQVVLGTSKYCVVGVYIVVGGVYIVVGGVYIVVGGVYIVVGAWVTIVVGGITQFPETRLYPVLQEVHFWLFSSVETSLHSSHLSKHVSGTHELDSKW